VAERYEREGFTGAKALLGGVDAWREAGYPMIGPIERKELAQGEKIEKKW